MCPGRESSLDLRFIGGHSVTEPRRPGFCGLSVGRVGPEGCLLPAPLPLFSWLFSVVAIQRLREWETPFSSLFSSLLSQFSPLPPDLWLLSGLRVGARSLTLGSGSLQGVSTRRDPSPTPGSVAEGEGPLCPSLPLTPNRPLSAAARGPPAPRPRGGSSGALLRWEGKTASGEGQTGGRPAGEGDLGLSLCVRRTGQPVCMDVCWGERPRTC